MKRFVFVLSFVLTLLAAAGCGGTGDSIASYSREIRVDDPVTVRLFDAFTLKDTEQAQEVCSEIRTVIRKLYGARSARAVSILYGGSMNAKNAAELLAMPDIDGGLIGGASLKPADFATIVAAAAQE